MLDKNSGLKSRIMHFFDFDDWDGDDCASFFENQASKKSYMITDEAIGIIKAGCDQLIKFPGWANGRDVNTLWDRAMAARASRVVSHPEEEPTITEDDIQKAIDEMVAARKPPDAKPCQLRPDVVM